MRVAITGASGFIGMALAGALRTDSDEVLTIGRSERSDIRWDPETSTLDPRLLGNVDAVVHLAGAPVG